MATTYLLTDTAEAQGWGAATYEQKMLTSVGTATTQSTSLASLALDVLVGAFIAPEGAGTLDWLITTSSQIEITTAAADVAVIPFHARVSADGATSRGATNSIVYQYGTGLKAQDVTWTAGSGVNTNVSRATTDRLVFYFRGRNDNMMIAQTLAWSVNDTDSFVTAPWDVAPPAAGLVIPRNPHRGLRMRGRT